MFKRLIIKLFNKKQATTLAKREPGFYWIKRIPGWDWEVGRWTGEWWALIATTSVYVDTELFAIGHKKVPF